ncbi:Glucosamine-6-phosphate isomerase (Glucosamine-6-phosphate deaminase) (GNPDA) (GlcN6P deaminase) [Tulasnella sp. 418]|nr:Glucosamine-6-phosphate isomerase (Glucosamine-6-phosphate deaminase) (GNPDA) (GlcN6P deaminase) [Tulasnella sp. 418]
MALTVGVQTVLDSREVVVVVTGLRKALALSKSVEEGINHLWTLSSLQNHPWALIVADEDATAGMMKLNRCCFPTAKSSSTVIELKVKTVKYFKSIEKVQDEVEAAQAKLSQIALEGLGLN